LGATEACEQDACRGDLVSPGTAALETPVRAEQVKNLTMLRLFP